MVWKTTLGSSPVNVSSSSNKMTWKGCGYVWRCLQQLLHAGKQRRVGRQMDLKLVMEQQLMDDDEAGVPHVILPHGLDTYDFARKAEYLGNGAYGNPSSAPRVEADEFRKALEVALSPEVVAKAKEVVKVVRGGGVIGNGEAKTKAKGERNGSELGYSFYVRMGGTDGAGKDPSPLRQRTRFDLPGFTLPLNFTPKVRSPEVAKGVYILGSFPEITMMRIMNTITDKQEWDRKVFDDPITSKWKEETLESGQDVTPKMMDWIIEKLKYKANIFRETGAVSAFDGDVVKSDTAIPETLKKALQEAVRALEDVPEHQRDYHPVSDNTVLDLVQPSLFPLVYGRSRILRDETIGLDDCLARSVGGEIIPVPPEEEGDLVKTEHYSYFSWPDEDTRAFSRKFQWLPCDVEFGDNNECYIRSYINNLHPKRHRRLYDIIQQIIARTIPLWNKTLTSLKPGSTGWERIQYNMVEYIDDKPEPVPRGDPKEVDWDAFDEEWEEWAKNRQVKQPEPGQFKPPPPSSFGWVEAGKFEGEPEYRDGMWHIEGQMNHHNWLAAVYGCEADGPVIQELGSVSCLENLLLTFPNILQHWVAPFSLADRSRPAHSKIFTLFLVDPHIRVISTANVPP
ncbi:hypothetical protein VTN00DRAFT_3679 [Thermoascus crustaceus]|uniref:uncharacterized protein n=1 Tax=Thermoascus crustaceus TaxID=5088 RepID=UPI00374291F5